MTDFTGKKKKNMNTTQQLAAIFNEWARRYAESPDEFEAILDGDGGPAEDYGHRSALFFEEIAGDLEAKGLLPPSSESPTPPPRR